MKFNINVIGEKDMGSIVSLDIREKLDGVTSIWNFLEDRWNDLTDVPCTRFDDRIPLIYSRSSKMKYVNTGCKTQKKEIQQTSIVNNISINREC